MAVNTETISRRVHGRATAAAAIEVSGLDTMPLESFTAFWEHMRDLANAALPKPETPAERQPMTDEQASLFGPTPLPANPNYSRQAMTDESDTQPVTNAWLRETCGDVRIEFSPNHWADIDLMQPASNRKFSLVLSKLRYGRREPSIKVGIKWNDGCTPTAFLHLPGIATRADFIALWKSLTGQQWGK